MKRPTVKDYEYSDRVKFEQDLIKYCDNLEKRVERLKKRKRVRYPTAERIEIAQKAYCSQDDRLGLRGRIFNSQDFYAGVDWAIKQIKKLNK